MTGRGAPPAATHAAPRAGKPAPLRGGSELRPAALWFTRGARTRQRHGWPHGGASHRRLLGTPGAAATREDESGTPFTTVTGGGAVSFTAGSPVSGGGRGFPVAACAADAGSRRRQRRRARGGRARDGYGGVREAGQGR